MDIRKTREHYQRQARFGFIANIMEAFRSGRDKPVASPMGIDRWVRLSYVPRSHLGGDLAGQKLLDAIRAALAMRDTDAAQSLVEFTQLVAADYADACTLSVNEEITARLQADAILDQLSRS